MEAAGAPRVEAELETPSFLGSAWDCVFSLPQLPQDKTDPVILASHGHPVGVRVFVCL